MASELQMWGVHAGRTGDADSLFIQSHCIALGWSRIGDLSKLHSNREAFKAAVTKHYPGAKAGAIPVEAGQLYRFVNEVKNGDIVVYPSKARRHGYIGRVAGPYAFDPSGETTYPHRRSVEWVKDFPRTQFSQGALLRNRLCDELFRGQIVR